MTECDNCGDKMRREQLVACEDCGQLYCWACGVPYDDECPSCSDNVPVEDGFYTRTIWEALNA